MHSDLGRYWYSTSPSLNRIAREKAEQLDEALVDAEIDSRLKKYINSVEVSHLMLFTALLAPRLIFQMMA